MARAGTDADVSRLREDELDAFFEVDGAAFGARESAPVRELIEAHFSIERALTSRDGGEVVGTALSEPSVITLPGLSRLPVAMVLGVAVLPSHRRQGRLTALMRRQLDDLHERGEVVATLSASEGGIYARFGYGVATFGARYEVDKQLARLGDSASRLSTGRVRLVTREEAREAFAAVYGEYALTRAGEVDRNELFFLDAIGDPGAEDLSRRFCAVYEEDGRIDGYLGYEIAFKQPTLDTLRRQVICHELCHLTNAAYIGLWQFLLGIDLSRELRAEGRPLDEPIRWLLTDHRHLRATSSRDRSWIRLVEVSAALAGRRYPQRGTLVLDVRDGFCVWNTGRYRLHVAKGWGSAQVERTDAPADIELDVSTLASIYLGGVAPSAFRVSDRVREKTDGALALADGMFANDRPPHCLTNF